MFRCLLHLPHNSADSYEFASLPTIIECFISAFLSREFFQHKRFSAGLQTPFRLKGTDLLCEQNFGARVLIDSALWISEPRRAACLLRLFSWLQMLNTRISAIPQSAMKRNMSICLQNRPRYSRERNLQNLVQGPYLILYISPPSLLGFLFYSRDQSDSIVRREHRSKHFSRMHKMLRV